PIPPFCVRHIPRPADWHRSTIIRHGPGLAASPPARDTLKSARSETLLFARPLWTDNFLAMLSRAAHHATVGRKEVLLLARTLSARRRRSPELHRARGRS